MNPHKRGIIFKEVEDDMKVQPWEALERTSIPLRHY